MAIPIGFFSKVAFGFKLLAIVFLFGALIMGIVDGAIIYAKEKDVKPLVDSTLGVIVGADAKIGYNVDKLKDSDDLDAEYVTYLKTDIWQNFAVFGFMWYMLYLFFDIFRRMGISDEQKNFWVTFMVIMFAGVFLVLSSVVYSGVVNDVWSYPFRGVVNLVQNWDVMSDAIGVVPDLAINATNSSGV